MLLKTLELNHCQVGCCFCVYKKWYISIFLHDDRFDVGVYKDPSAMLIVELKKKHLLLTKFLVALGDLLPPSAGI